MSMISRRGGAAKRGSGVLTTAGGVPIPAGWALQRLDTFGTAESVPGPVRLHSLYYEAIFFGRDSDSRVFIPNSVINNQQQTYQHFEDATWAFSTDHLTIQGRGQGDSSIKSGQLCNKLTARSFIFEARIKVPATLGMWVAFWAYAAAGGNDISELDVELLMSMNGTTITSHNVSLNNHPYAAPSGDPVSDNAGFSFSNITGLLNYDNAAFDKTSAPHYYTIYYDDTGSGTNRRYIDGVLIYHNNAWKWNQSLGGTGFGPDAALILDMSIGSGASGGQFPGTVTSPTTWSGDMDIYSVGVYMPGAAGRAVPAGQAWGIQKTSTITLSGGDLVATASAAGMCFAFDSVQSQAGRYYWEILFTDGANSGAGIGLYSTNASMTDSGDYLGRFSDQLGWYANGTVVVNNAVLTNWATYTGAVRLCFALDMISLKIWGRVGTAGNWNNAAIGSQNPAADSQVGGTAVPSGIRWNVVPGVNLAAAAAVATMVAASGSWAGTPPSGYTSASGNAELNIDFASVNSAQPAVTQYIGSAGISPYEFLPAGTISFDSLANSGVRTNLNSLGFKLMRIHVGNEDTIMSGTFPDASHKTYATATWTQFDSLFASLPSICNLATTRILLTGGVAPSWMTSTNAVTTLSGAQQYAVMMVAIATRAVAAGCEIFYWEAYNEPNPKMTSAQYAVLHREVATALKTYATGRSTTYFVGGPCIDQPPFSTWIADMVTTAGKANVDFLSWHDYMYGSGRSPFNSSNGVTWAQYVADAAARSGTAANAVTQARGADGTIPTTIPCCMTEYNMNYNSGTGTSSADGEVWQTEYRGAVWAALYIWNMLTQQSGANMSMMALYEAVGDSRFGVVRSTTVAAASIDPQGYLLKAFTALMPGSQVAYVKIGTLTNLAVLATVNGGAYGVMLVNYDATSSYKVAVSLQGITVGSSLTYTEISAANPTTLTSVIAGSALTALVIPAQSVVFLSP